MPSPFESFSLADLKKKIEAPVGYADNKLFYDGDHWNGGAFWSGPMPSTTESGGGEARAAIERGFVSSNVVAEMTKRFADALLGKEPAWGFTLARPLADGEEPTTQEQAVIDEAEALTTDAWDKRGIQRVLYQALIFALLGGRGIVRSFVPAAFVGTDGTLADGDIAAWMARLREHALEPTQAVLLVDDTTQAEAALWVYTKDNKARAELVYLTDDEQPLTVVRILDGERATDAEPLDLGGRLTMHAIEGPPLITPQIRQLQKSLNKSLTMMQHNEDLAGFTERTLLNTQMPGRFEGEGNGRRFIADPIQRGAGTVNNLVGVPIYNDAGELVGYATPSVHDRAPASPETFIQSQDAYYLRMLKEGDQLHVVITGDATASGESRKQARAGFEASLRRLLASVEQCGRNHLETRLNEAAALAGQAEHFAGLRATFQCRIDVGPIGADEQRVAAELYAAKGFDQEEFMARIGVQDIDAVKARLAQEQADRDRDARAPQFVQQPQTETAVGTNDVQA